MVFATKMSTCPKVPGRALLVRDHAIAQEAELSRRNPRHEGRQKGILTQLNPPTNTCIAVWSIST